MAEERVMRANNNSFDFSCPIWSAGMRAVHRASREADPRYEIVNLICTSCDFSLLELSIRILPLI
jgi:hypothetical protein